MAEQVKAVVAAVEEENHFFHDKIYRGVILANASVPDFVANKKEMEAQIEAQRAPALAQRMAEMPKYDAAIRKALAIHPHLVELVWSDPMAGHKDH